MTAPAAGWNEIGARLSAEVDTLRTSIQQLIAAGAGNAELEQAHETFMTSSRVSELLLDLDGYANTRKPAA